MNTDAIEMTEVNDSPLDKPLDAKDDLYGKEGDLSPSTVSDEAVQN